MNPRVVLSFGLLAAVWGASFLFIRVGAAPFGPVPLMAMRVSIAATGLLLFGLPGWVRHWKASDAGRASAREAWRLAGRRWHWLVIVGILNQALPFCLFGYAELSLSAGVTSVINATTPLWAALVAFVWLGERLTGVRSAGMALGFAGVLVLVWPDLMSAPVPGGGASAMSGASATQASATFLAPLAVLAATLCYGIAANLTRRHLRDVAPYVVASASMVAASAALLPLAVLYWPAQPVPPGAWMAVVALALVCTAFAYGLYYSLIAQAGPTLAVSVTFLIPVFGLLWGTLFLHEELTLRTLIGGAVVLAGTVLGSGIRLASIRVRSSVE